MDSDDETTILSTSHFWKEEGPECENKFRNNPILEQLPYDVWASSRKIYSDMNLPAEVQNACKPQLEFIERLRTNWGKESIAIPGAWKLHSGRIDQQDLPDGCLFEKFERWLLLVGDEVSYLEDKTVKNPSREPAKFDPDFRCSTSDIEASITEITQLSCSAFHEFLKYDTREWSAEYVTPYMFQEVPDCRLRCHPGFDFPSCMSKDFDPSPIDFALVYCKSKDNSNVQVDLDQTRVSLLNPALLVGVKGPAKWDHGPRIIYTSRTTQRSTVIASQEALCDAVESSLYCLVAHNLHNPSSPIPEWSKFIFGVMYDAEFVHIIAHIPYALPVKSRQVSRHCPSYSYISCIVDKIPYEGGYHCTKHSALTRFRLATAMLYLRNHAEFLGTKFDPLTAYSWPQETVDIAKTVKSCYQPTHPIAVMKDEEDEEEDIPRRVKYNPSKPGQLSEEARIRELADFQEPIDLS